MATPVERNAGLYPYLIALLYSPANALIRLHAHSHVHRYPLLSLVAHSFSEGNSNLSLATRIFFQVNLPPTSMASVSSLPGPALQASRTAVQAALAEHSEAEAHTTSKDGKTDDDGSLEPGEIQEVDMQAQAETIRTVFSDPKNFNVKVPLLTFLTIYLCSISVPFFWSIAPALFSMDTLVRFARNQGSKFTSDTIYCISTNTHRANAWRRIGVDGGYKAGHQF
jgi:hypothetical protein